MKNLVFLLGLLSLTSIGFAATIQSSHSYTCPSSLSNHCFSMVYAGADISHSILSAQPATTTELA